MDGEDGDTTLGTTAGATTGATTGATVGTMVGTGFRMGGLEVVRAGTPGCASLAVSLGEALSDLILTFPLILPFPLT
jgi:hypothetical protein